MYMWLKDYKNLEKEIEYLEYNLERSQKELKRWVEGDLAKFKITEKSIASSLEERIEVIRYELAHKMNDIHNLKKLIKTFEGLDYKILYMKHVEGNTLAEIAEHFNYSTNYIKNKHAELMKCIKYHEKVSSM